MHRTQYQAHVMKFTAASLNQNLLLASSRLHCSKICGDSLCLCYASFLYDISILGLLGDEDLICSTTNLSLLSDLSDYKNKILLRVQHAVNIVFGLEAQTITGMKLVLSKGHVLL